ncbi:acyltransferase ChoActase/COT/CPT [Mrakia frigida]|uniref:choline/carnitine O-acyltransferase n=1 Tax=Mrakia frigida TaxID=29902 RepID=UPI003FCBFED1
MPINGKPMLHRAPSRTLENQVKLPKLPIPALEDTMKKYLRALEGLQDPEEHAVTAEAVKLFLSDPEQGPRLQEKLLKYDEGVASYIEEFWYESYLGQTESVVLSLNPFFVLEDDPTPSRGSQLPRAASLILSSLGFIHDLREGVLEPDSIRGVPLDMDQYSRLFGTTRVPTHRGCRMELHEESKHIVVIRRGQFYWFDALDSQNRPTLSERDILSNLTAIVTDADKTPIHEVAQGSIGVLSTENRKVWSTIRNHIMTPAKGHNASCLRVVDSALFVVCLDDISPEGVKELCGNFLCGTYKLDKGVQVGTCTNRFYDKLQIIVCANGAAGINFEHTGVDGHTVLRYAADVYTELVLLFAKSINPSAPTLFKAKISPHAASYKPKPNEIKEEDEEVDTVPKKLTWDLTPEIKNGIRFAETRLSDLICQNDIEALEFTGYGKEFITRHGFSPDAYVQMAFQAAYYSLYGRVESTYEPAMTKAFLHGRTEAIRTVQPHSVDFVKTFCSGASPSEKIAALRKACKGHTDLTRECSKGLGQDRHLYAIYCLLQREINNDTSSAGVESPRSSVDEPRPRSTSPTSSTKQPVPELFSDPGWAVLNTSILSTSNCGNPALRLFGFGPVAPDGFGIGYIIKDHGISVVAASKHLQTRRFLDTLAVVMLEFQKLIKKLWLEANRPLAGPFHAEALNDRDLLTEEDDELKAAEESLDGYGFYPIEDDGTTIKRGRKKRVGLNLAMPE